MSDPTSRPVAVVGLGLIGGSVALALREAGVAVVGYAPSDDRELSRRAGVPVADSLTEAVRGARLVLLALPVAALREVAELARDASGAPVLHAASVQRPSALGFTPGAWMPLGTHPLAGSHRSGFGAADATLFRGARVSVEARATADEREAAEWLWRAVGAGPLEFRDAAAHDRQMAWTSHLPQLASVALAATVMGGGEPAAALGPGGRDSTRLAASPFDLWRDILAANADELEPALASLEREVRTLHDAVAARDAERLRAGWERTRAWREGWRARA